MDKIVITAASQVTEADSRNRRGLARALAGWI